MARWVGWYLVAIAAVAGGIAIWAGPNFAIAVPAGVIAVIAAGLLLVVGGVPGITGGSIRVVASASSVDAGSLRPLFRRGGLGREAILEEVDRIERAGPNPWLPSRRPEETARIREMPEEEFRRYVRERLDRLEHEW